MFCGELSKLTFASYPQSPKTKKKQKTQRKNYFSGFILLIKLCDESWYELIFGRTSDAARKQLSQSDADLAPGVAGDE